MPRQFRAFHCPQVILLVLVLCLVVVWSSCPPVPTTEYIFSFTKTLYNGTISENAHGKMYIVSPVRMGIHREDTSMQVEYNIVKREKNTLFRAESHCVSDFCFLRIRTRTDVSGELNREHKDRYLLRVKAVGRNLTGSVYTAFTSVMITVLDENDLSPLFYPEVYSVTIPENTPLHKGIVKVTASDADIGINGEIYYSFVQEIKLFSVHPTTGVVALTRSLNYTMSREHTITIKAEDRGPKTNGHQRTSIASLTVKVTPVNYYSPKLSVQKLPAAAEHGIIGTVYAIMTITDGDTGENGEIVNVQIISGNVQNIFAVIKSPQETDIYNIVINAVLDREKHPFGFNLTVSASDGGSPCRTTTTHIHVPIQDTNDNEPKFDQEEYNVSLSEVVPVNSPVLLVRAGDQDLGRNGEVEYSIIGGNEAGLFKIDMESGLVSTTSVLDAEKQLKVTLEIQAEDQANSGARKIGKTRVNIDIIDFNDNAPIFDPKMLTGSVKENAPKGTSVLRVSATDSDSGENGRISYSIVNVKSVPFEIDHFTGTIKTTESLDFELMKKIYYVKVRASDWGSPHRQENETVVTIKLENINDNEPEFEKVRCTGILSREARRNTEIVILPAIDFDEGDIIIYSIVDGNVNNCFDIVSSTGSITLGQCALSHLVNDTIKLQVVATDGNHYSAPTSVLLTLVNRKSNVLDDARIECQNTDVTERLRNMIKTSNDNNKNDEDLTIAQHSMKNDYAPTFSSSVPKYFEVSEGTPKGTAILNMTATDRDNNAWYNSKLLYVISAGNSYGAFKIDTFTGRLMVLSWLDREVCSEYNLKVTAVDMGKPARSANQLLRVVVTDENDNYPIFEHDHYEKSIYEYVAINSTVLQVYATDADKDLNARIQYSLLSHIDDFYIESANGMIKVKRQLDRERLSVYELSVVAKDSGILIQLSSTTQITIKLQDVNDNEPKFIPSSYSIRVREDLPVGSVVMVLTANDPDVGNNGKVTYMLVDGMEDKFNIDEETGTIRIQNGLDYEVKQVYNITAKAEDGGEPRLISTCLVNVEIVDVDENLYSPVFDDYLKKSYVFENKPVGTFVVNVGANDPVGPAEKNGQISYSIQDGSGLGRFTIDSNGTICTNQVLDRETASHYWLTVYAQDGGLVPRFARLEVLIEIMDENDNIPMSLEPAYHAEVMENSKSGVKVVQVVAEDGDCSHSQMLSFQITGGDPQQFFHIERTTGIITTTERSLNRENLAEHSLEVTISDNVYGNALSSSTRVAVKILDENDNRPRFADKAPTIRVLEETWQGRDIEVYRVVAQDKDVGDNARLIYTIKEQRGQTQFRVDPQTGMVYSTKDLLQGDYHELQVKAVDGGIPPRKAGIKLRVQVVPRPVVSPNPPSFLHAQYSLSVAENEPTGQLVEMLTGEDKDGDHIWYSIEGGNQDNSFAIQPEHGTLSVAGQLDWERVVHYNLTVCATDGLHKTCVPVNILVMDNNDHEPEFSQSLYTAEISESVAVNTDVVQVAATDQDQDKRLFYTFASAGSNVSMKKFQIHPQTGMIQVSQPLDREALSHHTLTVMVRDLGTPSKKSFARVKIAVLDHNDHAPQFLSTSFYGRVFETASVGTSVVQVVATDNDKGVNAEMSFSIISGNIGGAFAVDEKFGIVTVVKGLNRGMQSHYDLVVLAVDHGQPPLSATTHVDIIVTQSNNAPPIFTEKEYTAELIENMPAGHIVLPVHAVSQSSVVYSIVSGNHFDLMVINPNSGVISTKMVVDYEEHHLLNLTIKATNIVGASSNCTVSIHVLDENDNRPVFVESVYIGDVSETANPHSMVFNRQGSPLVVKAKDKDSGINSLLKYEILDVKIRPFFAIDSTTGAIKTMSTLDHEATSIYNFTVQVSDLGSPNLIARVPARVIIYVSDVNDSPPMFTNHTYMTQVLLPTYRDVIILHLAAHDPDTATVPLLYSIVRGNQDNVFGISHQSGELFVQNESNIQKDYELTVQVSDGKYITAALVLITVERTANTGLHFSQHEYTVSVDEEQNSSKELLAVVAVGHRLNEPLEFTLLNNRAMFTMKKTSGVLETQGHPFDRELISNYTVIVEVRDTHGRMAHGVIHVIVTDINDNAPQFIGLPYNSVIAYNASRGNVVKKVEAFDGDEGNNGQVRFSLTDGGEGKFNINLITGEITVEKLQAPDKNKVFQLTVEAQDMGRPPQRQEAVVPVHVVDTNSPVFKEQVYNISVNENLAMHTPITKIEASSPQNDKLIYSITKGDKYGDFAVNFDTGLISVVGALDYEESHIYELTLRATDTQTGSYTEAIVFVCLQDVNDNAPVFDSQIYTKAVMEAVPIGTEILSVRATDRDTNLNKQVHYSIAAIAMGNQDVDSFHIDSETGVVWVKKHLDYEVQSDFYFLVIAIDSGLPALNATVTVHIKVLNVNDNAPKFSKVYYECSITDQVTRGQLVTKVMAYDDDQSNDSPDQSVNEALFFSIVDGNEKLTFAIDPNSGLISVSEQRKPVFESLYVLNVSVSDGVYTNYAQVTIAVRNSNSHSPVFHNSVYYADFSEINAAGMPVVTVSATDEDRGTYGLVTYTIPSDRLKTVFHIDADTGEIFTKMELDRETKSQYVLPVVATDNGGRMGFTEVHVTVADYNDCIPHFLVTNYQGNVFSNATHGQAVLQVEAVDEDAGVNGKIVYSLYPSGNTQVVNLFKLNQDTGLITVQGDLSHLVNKVFQFFVGAANKEETSMQDRAAVDILVMGAGDSPPAFERSQFAFFILEDININSVIATLRVSTIQPVKYSIVAGTTKNNNQPARFSINSKAQITVSEKLDREEVPSYLLTVKAETKTSPPLVAYTQVNITLRDINDNNPILDSTPYTASVSENAPPDTKIIQLQAFDKDQLSVLIYKFGEGMEEIANIFSLDAHSGWLTLMASLDREKKNEYNITVVVYDSPDTYAPSTHSSSGNVIVSVTDFNDNPPVFQHKHYKTAVDECAALGTVLRNISAVDGDTGDNAVISYYITSGDSLGQFQVYSTAEIFVSRPLDRENKNFYELSVAATDGGFVTYITVTVDILDDNDHSPVCEKSLYTKFVDEDVPINTIIEHIQATDEDEANTRNSKLSYFLSGHGAEFFFMEKESGVLRTVKALDREQKSEFHLVVSAVDGGSRSCTTDVLITVNDVNDNRPEFTLESTTFHIAENVRINTLLVRVTAKDVDSGINRQILFELGDEDRDVFMIDPVSGIISVLKSLDREKQSEYNVTVIAYNPGFRQFSSTLKLLVLVGDVNDNPPKFKHTNYYVAVREDAYLESRILQVFATSQDIGKNAKITYSITGGNEQGKFKIDPASGTLRVAEPLDHELSKQYFLTVTASDMGDHPLSSTTIVVVNVTDVNDNAPQFGQTSYSCSVKEDILVGREVIRVQATDVDSPPNAVIHYSILKGDLENKFVIGVEDGVIRIKNGLDRERVDKYALIVEAKDSGMLLPRSASTVVTVEVMDANDNPPRFNQANYTAVVQEGRQAGMAILQFSVTDIDLEENGPPFDFDIISGNTGMKFHVSRDGLLSTAAKLNKELKDSYELTIRVFDSGQPVQYADTSVIIHVVDESIYPPVVRNLSITISSYRDRFPGGVIGKVDYQDDDLYDTVTFQVVSNNRYLFDVDRDNGNVIAVLGLDAGRYEVNISVTDGKFTSYSLVTVNVVSISEEMISSAITIQFKNMIPEQFFANSKKDFQSTLKRELDVSARSIEIINVQPATITGLRESNRWKRDASSNLDVLFAVRKSGNRYINKNSLRKKVSRVIHHIEDGVGVKVTKVFGDMCDESICSEGVCVGKVVFDNNKLMPVIVGGESFVSARHYYSYQCVCVGGDCETQICGGLPCPAFKLCEQDDFGKHVCVCPNGLSGEQCDEESPECKPSDASCHKGELPMTFTGHSYARWELGVKTDKRLSLSLWLRTRKLNANLMNSKGKADYSVLEIINGHLQYRFNCGSGEGLVTIPILVNNGLWHKVSIERNGRLAQMELDETYHAMSTAPGTNDILNLPNDSLYFGAEVTWHSNYQDITHGFEGCMRDIRVFNVPLLFSGQNKVTKDQQFEKIDFNCKEDPWQTNPNICSSQPCMHGGTCVYTGLNSYICQCKTRYQGSKCEVDTNPCEDGPCMHQGQCWKDSEIPNGFFCKCRGRFRGKRCEYGDNCIPNPCLHGGVCIEGPHRHICQCQPGYEGDGCELTTNVCRDNPCRNGGTCHTYAGGAYHCNCTADRKGQHCDEIALPVITGGIKAEEIYGIAGVGAGLILIVFIFVMCRLWRRKKRDRRGNRAGIIRGDDEIQYHGMKEHELKRKLSNPDMTTAVHTYTPQPPPVPTRPASYTPSTHDSLNTLNNFDTVRNYGSAADELEATGIHNIPTFQEYLETFQSSHRNSPVIPSSLPPHPRSSAASDSDSIQKQPWEFDYPNILEHYAEDKKGMSSKCMPGMTVMPNTLQHQDACSYSSLPVSESEEDLNGYHWDTSDWAPRPSLPNISEVPAKEIPDSPISSNNSEDLNIHISNIEPDPGILTDDPGDYVEDSEYVGDSEYAENEFGLDENDDLPPCYADHPNYEQILELRDMDDTYELPQSLQVSHHPNHYLPNYSFSGQMEQVEPITDDDNSNVSDDNDNDSVIHYGYQNAGSQSNNHVVGYVTENDRSAASILDDLSVSAGGYTSTNGSCSDVSAYLCEIEDSEINPSDESEDEDQSSQRLLAAHLHTKV